ncbi:MAG: oligopeptidase A [Candidatus Dactylopiibacterium carminicum]|uniref:oligopeptidase A n=1 Tax=Candidatus Dactylopiibacterium carminicum TaxID=857335 RepID=A0A272ERA8_9RHOO|nr:M3 family metallopeptidase [Candidatus Dactylopiibacterium carminicum]KAF7598735.1 M3 family peptidase [Candidatus Dactylopiibacterium carminicum]PAS92647.1 MAG: oligopeptidase A [Candidatus Dactylopiibacterium carminicum]PAS96137.1 MAG: oligopeptidase A [Candidatus Dactylopiibacterium carminicum]PAS98755.1 MAG: oligopeptidase A [Candidatus Dactylopiibacterium carminicum]
MNPLLDLSSLPRFDTVRPEHVAPAIQQLLAEGRALIARQTQPNVTPSWDDFVAPLIDAGERLSRAWGIVGHLHSVLDITSWREAYNAMLPEVTQYYAELGQNLALFAKYKAIRASDEYGRLTPVRQRIIDNEIRDFRLSGAELPEDQKPRFQSIQQELAALAAKFSENVLDATNAFTELVTDEKRLAGLPTDAIAAARAEAEAAGRSGWLFTLRMPSYLPVIQYAEDRLLRETLYRASATRASEFSAALGHPEWDNAPNIARIVELRRELASMLGYHSYAEVSLVPKMADSPEQVLAFLRDLGTKAKPYAERDMAELNDFARNELAIADLQPWDIGWAAEKLRQARYSYSDQEVKQYFPEPRVLAGLFNVVEKLYGVNIREDQAPVWDADVRFFRIERDGTLIGQFYLDLHARATKRGGAWMDSAISRRRTTVGVQVPVAYLVCNFPGPVDGRPATFSHDDVQTLFHEAGHGLHHLLTRVDELWVSGISGVEWDAVELPSQFMENFCWEWDVLSAMTAHIDTGETLPRELFDKMLAAKNFQSGMQTVRQLEFALFDLRLHHDWQLDTAGVQPLLEEVRREVAVLFPPAWHRFANSFSHIFAGGYAAGYYSYKWAKVLSADAYAAFEEARATCGSTLDAQTGARFLKEILSVGGARPAIESFKAFRGREPEVDALLRHSGMATA